MDVIRTVIQVGDVWINPILNSVSEVIGFFDEPIEGLMLMNIITKNEYGIDKEAFIKAYFRTDYARVE